MNKEDFEAKLKQLRQEHQTRTEAEAQKLRQYLLDTHRQKNTAELRRRLQEQFQPRPSPPIGTAPSLMVQINRQQSLAELDQRFIDWCQLSKVYPVEELRYPIYYCTTAEEFYSQPLKLLQLSQAQFAHALERMIAQAQKEAQQSEGLQGIFGIDLPGLGCYLNGWLFGFKHQRTPQDCWQDEQCRREILSTAVHEKLGHGFLRNYSTIGKEVKRLGLLRYDLAQQAGVRFSDDPWFNLRLEQFNLIFSVSQLLEEGWATWIASLFVPPTPANGELVWRFSIDDVLDAVERSAALDLSDQKALWLAAIDLVFSADSHQAGDDYLYQLRSALDLLLDSGLRVTSARLGVTQPIAYALGEMLFAMAAMRFGASLMPYLALLAGNVNPQIEALSLSDLAYFLRYGDPRLNPNTRLAALVHLQIDRVPPISLSDLANAAEEQLGFASPPAFQQEATARRSDPQFP